MLRMDGIFLVLAAAVLGFAGASHQETTATPISGASHQEATVTPISAEDSPLKDAFERIADRTIASSIYNFYYYNYDSPTRDRINDGGDDMYDGGNMVYFWLDSNSSSRITYNSYYVLPDVYELSSMQSWPFIALMHINNTFSSHYSFSIRVDSNTGADGSGSIIYFNNSATFNGSNVAYTVTQVYGTSDPTICEVYFAFGSDKFLNESFVPLRNYGSGTDSIASGASLTDYPQDVWLGYMLLSRSFGVGIEPWEVSNSVIEVVSAVLDVGNNSIPFPFQILPNVFPPSTTTTTTTPTTPSPISNEVPQDSPLRMAFERIANKSIPSSISDFYFYNYDSSTGYSIDDGGYDMYDGGNMVYWTNDSVSWNRLDYDAYSSYQGVYEVSIMQSWPFIALMRIENSFQQSQSFSFRVDSNTGADGRGSIVYFNNSATFNSTNVAYTVTQVYGTSDPTICEVYFAFGNNISVIDNFTPLRYSGTGTDYISSGARIAGYPKDVWLGYMLLSRPNGRRIEPWEVSDSVIDFVAALLDVGNDSIPFPFQTVPIIFPTNPPTTAPTTPPSIPNEIPVNSTLRMAFEKIANRSISSSISDFYFYRYDSPTNDRILDGGSDMYDGGNMVYWTNDSIGWDRLAYSTYYWSTGIYEVSIMRSWPFVALMRIENTFRQRSSFSFRVDSNTGADGYGSIIHFNNSATFNGTNVAYTVTQVYGTSDPTICEVYFAFGNNISVIDNFFPLIYSGSGTDYISSGARIAGYPEDVWLGYMLLSRPNGRRIEPWEVSNSVVELVCAVLDVEYNSSHFSFQTLPNVFPTTQAITSPTPSTISPPFIPGTIPNGSAIHHAFEGLAPKLSLIASSISRFYYYNGLNFGSSSISDGGNDMYDGGNRVSFGYDGLPKLSATYGSYYSQQDTYEFASLVGWPFVALMRINNTFNSRSSFSMRVTSNAGADGSGVLTHFSSNANSSGINVAYSVTQVYNAFNDPSICEVYLAFNQNDDIVSNFVFNAMSTGTNNLDTEIILQGFPQNSWIGYMLLSKERGRMVSPNEVNLAVSQFVSAVFGFNYTIPFSFPYYPTQGPATTAPPTTTPYQQYAYVGFKQEVCGTTKFTERNYTICPSNQTAFVTSVTVELPTNFGFSYPAEGTISGCMGRDQCSQGCRDIGNLIGQSASILSCQSRCCYTSYCNYAYYPFYYYPSQPSNFTTPNITIPESQLPGVSVEVFPNCFFKSLASRLTNCANNVFNAWPFSDSSSCKLTISSAVRCGMQEILDCTTTELFSNAMARFSSNTNFQQIATSIEQSGYLDIICVHPSDNIRNATIAVSGSYGDTYYYPLFPEGLIGIGEPICDRFILDSLLDWGIEFLSVLKTSTSRFEMCRSYKTVVNRVLNAAENRCNLNVLPSLFPCDSLLRNQLRALIVQAKEFLPQIVPDYCEGIEVHPDRPDIPDDIPFLPSCSLRQTVRSMWSCESLFTSKTPYSDDGTCKTNINRLLHCVANRLEECSRGAGYNFFDALTPFLRLEDILATIRSLTKPSGCSPYGYSSDFRDLICSSSAISLPQFNNTLGNLYGLCRGDSSGVYQQIVQAYYKFAGARNSADVCTAFRLARDSIYEYFKDNCNFGLLQYLLPIDSTARTALSHGIEVLIHMLPDLKVSVCPEPVSTNATFTPTRWLRSYVRWRSYALPKWQAAYEEWRSDQPEGTTMATPSCLDLTGITCRNTGSKLCESDYFGCGFCYCSDHVYKGLTDSVLEPWLQDYENWENFQASWERDILEWEENNKG